MDMVPLRRLLFPRFLFRIARISGNAAVSECPTRNRVGIVRRYHVDGVSRLRRLDNAGGHSRVCVGISLARWPGNETDDSRTYMGSSAGLSGLDSIRCMGNRNVSTDRRYGMRITGDSTLCKNGHAKRGVK